jgi:hypothetical protein
MCEETCSDGFDNFIAQVSKWRDDSDQHTVEHTLKFLYFFTYILYLPFIFLCRLWSCHMFLPNTMMMYLAFLLGLYISLVAR